MFTTQEAVTAEIDYRMEQAREAALGAQFRRPSLVRRLLTRAPRTASTNIARGAPLSART